MKTSLSMVSIRNLIALVVVLFVASALARAADPIPQDDWAAAPQVQKIIADSTYTPAPRGNDPWVGHANDRFATIRATAAAGNLDLVFLGDSITDGWLEHDKVHKGIAQWHEYYDGYRVANFGIGADGIQHTLWRLVRGELPATLKPKIFIVNIGTNNIGDPAEKVAAGVTAVVNLLHYRCPEARILLLGIFPRDPKPTTAWRKNIIQVNAILAKLDDGKLTRFLDIGPKFLDADGNLAPTIMPDALHPGPAGYRIWADSMAPLLAQLMTDTGITRQKIEVKLPPAVLVPHAPADLTLDSEPAAWQTIPSLPLPFMQKQSSSLSLCWTDAGLLGLLQVKEEQIKSNPKAPWSADCLELWLEKDAARSWDNTLASAQYVFCPLPDQGPGPAHVLIPYGSPNDTPAKIRTTWKPTPTGFALTFLIPADSLQPAKLAPGTKLGFNFALSQKGHPTEQFFTDKSAHESYWTPSTWGLIELDKAK